MITHNNPECRACTGEYSCTLYCPMRVGRNIEQFMANLDSLETSIGDIQKDYYEPKRTLMVTGSIIEKYGEPSKLLRDSSCISLVKTNNKLCSFMGLTALQHLNTYCAYKNVSSAKKSEIAEKIKKFNSNKCVPCPVSPGSTISVHHKDFYGKKIITDAEVDQVRYELNDSGDLEAYIYVPVPSNENGKKYVIVKMEDYLDTWNLPNIENNVSTGDMQHATIKMTPIGFVKPIVFQDSKYTLALDSVNLFINKDGNDHIIGYWDKATRGIKVDVNMASDLKNSKAFKALNKTVNYIAKHQRFILPYGLTEPNIVICK